MLYYITSDQRNLTHAAVVWNSATQPSSRSTSAGRRWSVSDLWL